MSKREKAVGLYQMSKQIVFEKINNARDLGGMIGDGGKHIVSGKLIRCGHLSEISQADRKSLGEMLSVIIDFRTDGERSEKPDVDIAGVEYHHIPIMDNLTAGITREEEADRDIFSKLLLKPSEAKAYMCSMYRTFAESEYALTGYQSFIDLLCEKHEKSILWHCTAGKDRAGIASAIVEEILGVSRSDIIEDYLATNAYLEGDIRFLTEFVKKQAGTDSELADESLRYLFGADREYIETYYRTVEDRYGDFSRFLRNGLKVNQEKIERLCSMYLG